MKKIKLTKVIVMFFAAISMLSVNSIGASAEWKKDSNGWWYTSAGSTYTGWNELGQNWYYFNSNGYLAHDTVIGGYYLDSSGVWVQNSYRDPNNINKNIDKKNITFLDKNLEQEIRNTIGKQSGEINSQDLLGITELNLYNKKITYLNGIENLVNLTNLNLKNNVIKDITPLSSLTKLKNLDIGNYAHGNMYYNSIEDITPLKSLTNLETLSLSTLQLRDIDALSNLKNLKDLNMYYCLFDVNANAISISSLENLSNLETLNLDYCNITDISALQNLKNLKNLSLAVNDISDVNQLKNLSNLTDLYLLGNKKLHSNNSAQMLQKSLPNCKIKY